MEQININRAIIYENYHHILDRINKTADAAGRNPDDIRLVVVTKTKPIEVVQLLIEAGARDFGENYVEEAIPKIQALAENKSLQWHMIGHLQSRKALIACEIFDYLHSLDSLKLAERLCRSAQEMKKSLPAWMEFNISGEESKSGWDIANKENWKYYLPDIEKILQLPNIKILGLMTIPPFSTDPEASRPYFKKLRNFQEYVKNQLGIVEMNELSIGMSSDFEVAIQEGSTCVRIGQAILGPRSN